MMLSLTLSCLAIAPVAAGAPMPAPAGPPAVLERVRESLGDVALRRHPHGFLITGEAVHLAEPAAFTLQFSPDGRFRRELSGPLGETVGFDGRTVWYVDTSGLSSAVLLEQREVALLSLWVLTGHWLEADSVVVAGPEGGGGPDDALVLTLRLRGGVAEGRLTIDRSTWRPRSFSLPTTLGMQTWGYEDYRESGGLFLPRRVTHAIGPLADSYTVKVSAATLGAAADRFAMPIARPADTRFGSGPARVETRKTATGHILVRPRVDGKDLGWFILDTGAGLQLITPEAADAAGMARFGKRSIAGAGPETTLGRYRQGRSFELGPVLIENLRYVEFDLGPLSAALGEPLAGVVGYDLFSRAVVVFGRAGDAVEIHDPDRFRLESGAWQDLILHGNHPHVRLRFGEGREGLFRIDTGGGPAQVIFHSPAVEKWRLLEGKDLGVARLGGAGGMFDARVGTIEWLEIGGRRIEAPMAIFTLAGSGALDDPYTEGTLGWGVFARFTMVIDYPHRRLAFAPPLPQVDDRGPGPM